MDNLNIDICLQFASTPDINFHCVSTEPLASIRSDVAPDLNFKYDFCIRSYESDSAEHQSIMLGKESDIVIISSPPMSSDHLVEDRLRKNKLTFRATERYFKRSPLLYLLYPKYRHSIWKKYIKYCGDKQYVLSIGSHTPKDARMLGIYKNNFLNWGYFTETIDYNIDELLTLKNQVPALIVWSGRLVELKHPEKAVYVAKALKHQNIQFKMIIAGGGDMEATLRRMINAEQLDDCVEMLGMISNDLLRKYMSRASVYLMTSDHREGWGAVVNEAMNGGCAVVGHINSGSTLQLINSYNGMIYRTDEELVDSVVTLLRDQKKREEISVNAYNTISQLWNAKVAVSRLLTFSEKLERGEDVTQLYDTGPCSLT